MPGPLSTPNGDTTLARGHVNEKFVCNKHGDKNLDLCEAKIEAGMSCSMVPLRNYLADRNRLRTGKTV